MATTVNRRVSAGINIALGFGSLHKGQRIFFKKNHWKNRWTNSKERIWHRIAKPSISSTIEGNKCSKWYQKWKKLNRQVVFFYSFLGFVSHCTLWADWYLQPMDRDPRRGFGPHRCGHMFLKSCIFSLFLRRLAACVQGRIQDLPPGGAGGVMVGLWGALKPAWWLPRLEKPGGCL